MIIREMDLIFDWIFDLIFNLIFTEPPSRPGSAGVAFATNKAGAEVLTEDEEDDEGLLLEEEARELCS